MYTLEQIENAYRKFKSHIYYSTGNLFYREIIADFECDDNGKVIKSKKLVCQKKLINLKNWLNRDELDIKSYESRIKYFAVPKKAFTASEIRDSSSKSTNSEIVHNTQEESSHIKRLTYMIDVPIEIHIISTLWVMQNGIKFEEKYKKYNYGNILASKFDIESDNLRLFKPYFYNYQKWRDNSIEASKIEAKAGNNVAIIGLDVKDFYDSCQLKRKDFILMNEDPRIGSFLFDVSKKFYDLLPKETNSNKFTGLPIGLLSSSILANYYLSSFDQLAVKSLSPVFYGRYVDDITLVVRISDDPKTSIEINNSLNYVIRKLTQKRKNKKNEFLLRDVVNMAVQKDKIIKYYFDSSGPITLLDKFAKEIKQNSSEFRFLPEDSHSNSDFLDSAYAISYTGSKQKLRNIDELSPDKFGVSTFLAKNIYSALTLQDKYDDRIAKDILAFFKSTRAIEFSALWEKAFTYFVVTNDSLNIKLLYDNIIRAISNTVYEGKRNIPFDIQETLRKICNASIAMALSLNTSLLNEFKDDSTKFLKSNMVRHKYVSLPMLSYIKSRGRKKNIDLTKGNYFQYKFKKDKSIDSVLRDNVFKFCPRYIPFHEIVIFYVNFNLILKDELDGEYLKKSFELFYKVNYNYKYETEGIGIHFFSLRNQYFTQVERVIQDSKKELKTDLPIIEEIVIPSSTIASTTSIAIGNIEISDDDIYHSLINQPVANEYRKNNLFSIINQASGNPGGVDFLVLPEASVPNRWFDLLATVSKREKMAFVFGLEHLVTENYAHNLIINLLPVEISNFGNESPYIAVIPIVRIKNHYSPSEVEEVHGYHHKVPIIDPAMYHLITWNDIVFTTFNCFELTNITHRSFFKSRIDILFACEYNVDVNYFSTLVESSARDLHCYVVQSNSSFYGDSRITQPTKTATKDILKIKGGTNPSALIGKVNIQKLRKFQYLRWNLQLKDKRFKATPPGFDRENVRLRLGIKGKTKKS